MGRRPAHRSTQGGSAAEAELRAGPELCLRPLRTTDLSGLFALVDRSRPRLRRWLPWAEGEGSLEETAAFIRAATVQAAAGEGFQAAILWRGELAGVIGHHDLRPDGGSVSLGYWLGDGFEGQGLATAACRAIVGHAFAALGLQRVEIRAATANRRSRAVAERLGFRLEGILRQAERLGGAFVDHAVYGMVAGEWTRLRGLRPPQELGEGARPARTWPRVPEDSPEVDREMARYYQERAPEYDDWYERRGAYADPATDATWFAELAQLHGTVAGFAAGLPPGSAICDVGCGTGRWTAALAERLDLSVIGLDRAPGMLAQAAARCQGAGLRAVLVEGDALALPFVSGCFDAALSGFVFDHLAAHQRATYLAELRRIVRPGGRVLILDSRRQAHHAAEVEIQRRSLRDGRTFSVRKTLFVPATLAAALGPLGPAQAGGTANHFVWAEVGC